MVRIGNAAATVLRQILTVQALVRGGTLALGREGGQVLFVVPLLVAREW